MLDVTALAGECIRAADLLDLTPLKALDISATEKRHGRQGRKQSCLPRVDGIEATDREFLDYLAGRLGASVITSRLRFRLLVLRAADLVGLDEAEEVSGDE